MLENKVKNLGFYIDENLNYNKQINTVCQKGFFMIRNLWKISSKITDVQLKIQIIQSCVLCHIDFCNALYSRLPKKQIKKLQRLINFSIRFVYNLKPTSLISISEYAKRCHFLPAEARIEFKICLLAFKCINEMAPTYLMKMIQSKESLQSLRVYNNCYSLPITRTYIKNKLQKQNIFNRRSQTMEYTTSRNKKFIINRKFQITTENTSIQETFYMLIVRLFAAMKTA